MRTGATVMLTAGLGLAAAPSAARTAEETVAFLYQGYEDGAVVNRYRASATSAAPARFTLTSEEPGAAVEELTVEKLDGCRYALTLGEAGTGGRPPLKAMLDFAKVRGIAFEPFPGGGTSRAWIGARPDFCRPARAGDPHCGVFTRRSLALPPAATRERMTAAMAELRALHCKTTNP